MYFGAVRLNLNVPDLYMMMRALLVGRLIKGAIDDSSLSVTVFNNLMTEAQLVMQKSSDYDDELSLLLLGFSINSRPCHYIM